MAEHDPFSSATPTEIPLPHAPLIRVIAQVRFPLALDIEQREFVSPFQQAVKAIYPVLRPEQTNSVLLAGGTASVQNQIAWRFSDLENAWRLSLTPEFLALETVRYSSRRDFFERFAVVVDALAKHVTPQIVDRIGVRYIDRISASDFKDIAQLVRPEVRGVIGSAVGGSLQHSICETLFSAPEGKLLAKWGCLPARATTDPAAIEPANEDSWILDLDMFSTEQQVFKSEAVVAQARVFAEKIYSVFRWVVTDAFLRKYGGQV